MLENKTAQSIFEVNLLFLITTILFIGASVVFGIFEVDFFTHVAIIQYVILLVPVFGFIIIRGYNFEKTLKLNPITLKQGLLSGAIMITAMPISVFLNTLALYLLSLMGKLLPPQVPAPETLGNFFMSLFFIAVLPGICEELFFRGLLLSCYEKIGARRGIIYTAFIFAIFHFDIQRLIGVMFLGLVFGYMVYYTRSIFTSMIAHAVNNGISVGLSYLLVVLKDLAQSLESVEQVPVAASESEQLLGALAIYGIISIISGIVLVRLLKTLRKTGQSSSMESTERTDSWLAIKKTTRMAYFTPILIVLAVALLIYVNQIADILGTLPS